MCRRARCTFVLGHFCCLRISRILPTMSKRHRRILTLLAIVVAVPGVLVITFLSWRSSPVAGGPRIGLSMASSIVIQRPLYEEAIAQVSGQPVLITPTDDDQQLSRMLDEIDALLLTGGGDVDPMLYNGDSAPLANNGAQRDLFEIRLIRAAVARELPILGICRGVQILNVAHGGTLRDLREDEALSERHGIGTSSFSAHEVAVVVGTRLAEVVGAGTHRVNSFHGQAVERVGAELRVCATADDGLVEAVERPDRPFVVGGAVASRDRPRWPTRRNWHFLMRWCATRRRIGLHADSNSANAP